MRRVYGDKYKHLNFDTMELADACVALAGGRALAAGTAKVCPKCRALMSSHWKVCGDCKEDDKDAGETFKGVSKKRATGNFEASFFKPDNGGKVVVGVFATATEAAVERDKAMRLAGIKDAKKFAWFSAEAGEAALRAAQLVRCLGLQRTTRRCAEMAARRR
jgi:hypothetical protein